MKCMGLMRWVVMAVALLAVPAMGQRVVRAGLLTCYPGGEIYELEGHTGLRIVLDDGTDVTANYGLFDFDTPNFVYRFVKGETDYRMGIHDTRRFVEAYRRQGRRVVEQPLNLSAEQLDRLYMSLVENSLPQNAVYRYNYVLDNCATRPVAMIEGAIGDTIAFATPTTEDGTRCPRTFREWMRHYHRDYPWYQFGIDLALGSGIDRQLTDREAIYAPVTLTRMLETATVADPAGNQVALTGPAMAIVDLPADNTTQGPTPWYLTPMAVALAVLALTTVITIRDTRRGRVTRWYGSLLFAIFGLAGCLLTFLVFVSSHYATSPNWLLLWLNPLCLAGAVGIWLKKWKNQLFYYHFVNFVALLALVIILPWVGQSANAAFWPLIASDAMLSASYIYINRCVINRHSR
ncbi:MAG: DUF4105 domain-containing protein [Pseudoflavonifractor sp.]|nr:DUF4105 domain-containing protein [Pseudoflavonifractor sp.]